MCYKRELPLIYKKEDFNYEKRGTADIRFD